MVTDAQGKARQEAFRPAKATLGKLEAYCRAHDWVGFDPYDALNSELFARTPLIDSRAARLGFTQLLKRSPVNVRPLLRIRPRPDPKATSLFLMSYALLARNGDQGSRAAAEQLSKRLLGLRSPHTRYWCWGYSFPWQTRDRLVPRFGPNIVATTFAANSLLDAHEIGLGAECLTAALSAGDYIASELYWNDGQQAGFAYPLSDIRAPIHNANFLGAALLCRLGKCAGQAAWVDAALAVARYSASAQREDGSWPYGTGVTQQWVDNFHTGYNLCALQAINAHLGTEEFEPVLLKGVQFFRDQLFAPHGVPKYFHDRTYPIDIHCVAQSLVTLTAFRQLDARLEPLAEAVLAWAMRHMWDDRGFFYYRVLRSTTIRIPYMRWSQAWMLLALAILSDQACGG